MFPTRAIPLTGGPVPGPPCALTASGSPVGLLRAGSSRPQRRLRTVAGVAQAVGPAARRLRDPAPSALRGGDSPE